MTGQHVAVVRVSASRDHDCVSLDSIALHQISHISGCREFAPGRHRVVSLSLASNSLSFSEGIASLLLRLPTLRTQPAVGPDHVVTCTTKRGWLCVRSVSGIRSVQSRHFSSSRPVSRDCGRAAETCELVIMDRGFDPVAPIIHDWTYEPMVYDLLAPEGSTYRYHAENNKGALPTIYANRIVNCIPTLSSTLARHPTLYGHMPALGLCRLVGQLR